MTYCPICGPMRWALLAVLVGWIGWALVSGSPVIPPV
jgi:hypothetical protein